MSARPRGACVACCGGGRDHPRSAHRGQPHEGRFASICLVRVRRARAFRQCHARVDHWSVQGCCTADASNRRRARTNVIIATQEPLGGADMGLLGHREAPGGRNARNRLRPRRNARSAWREAHVGVLLMLGCFRSPTRHSAIDQKVYHYGHSRHGLRPIVRVRAVSQFSLPNASG